MADKMPTNTDTTGKLHTMYNTCTCTQRYKPLVYVQHLDGVVQSQDVVRLVNQCQTFVPVQLYIQSSRQISVQKSTIVQIPTSTYKMYPLSSSSLEIFTYRSAICTYTSVYTHVDHVHAHSQSTSGCLCVHV